MDFEDIIKQVGDYGRYQKRAIYFFLLPLCAFAPWFSTPTLFMISAPDHWCRVDSLVNVSTTQLRRELISPPNALGVGLDSCSMYDLDYSLVGLTGYLPNITNVTTKQCDNGWEYDHTYYDENAVTHLDLVCDQQDTRAWILSLGSIGTVIGTPFFGYLGDKIGRRHSMVVICAVFLLSTISPILLKDLYSFMLFRVVMSLTTPAGYQIAFVMVLEMVGPDSRTFVTSLTCIVWAVGLSIVPLVVYLARSWVILGLISTCCGIILLCLTRITNESARWLISKGRYTEALAVLKDMARVNGVKEFDEVDMLSQIKRVGTKLKSDETAMPAVSRFTFLTNPRLRKFFCLIAFSWIAVSMGYYGLTYHAMSLHGNEFLNFFFLAIIEMPAYFLGWYMMETRLGRRWSNVLAMFFGSTCLLLPVLFDDTQWPLLTSGLAVAGKMGITMAAQVVYQQAAELYPTPLRNQGLAACATISAAAGIYLPQLIDLTRFGVWVPMFVLGTLCMVDAVVSAFIPETLNTNLPQTIEEAEIFGQDVPFWSLARMPDRSVLPDLVKPGFQEKSESIALTSISM